MPLAFNPRPRGPARPESVPARLGALGGGGGVGRSWPGRRGQWPQLSRTELRSSPGQRSRSPTLPGPDHGSRPCAAGCEICPQRNF